LALREAQEELRDVLADPLPVRSLPPVPAVVGDRFGFTVDLDGVTSDVRFNPLP
jgi:hypothetical protein